jgi:K+-transporting ATPase KdpF subunit
LSDFRKERPHDRSIFHRRDARLLRPERPLRLRLRETLAMDTIVAGIAVLLIVYLFWSLLRPEHF